MLDKLPGFNFFVARPSGAVKYKKTLDAHKPTPQQARRPDKVLTDIAEIGQWKYIPLAKFELESLREKVAVLQDPNEERYVLLIADAAWDSMVSIEAKGALNSRRISFRPAAATTELIAVLHMRYTESSPTVTEDRSSIQQMAEELVDTALDRGASDVHLEIREDYAQVYYRIYGQRVRVQTLSRDTGISLAQVLYDVEADSSAKTKVAWDMAIPIDAVINWVRKSTGAPIQIRYASAPIYPSGCCQVVCRLLEMSPRRAPSFWELGYEEAQAADIESMLFGSQGLVLMVGPTNSGKSTTMQAMARLLQSRRGEGIKIETIEDPVEYIIPGALQMPVSSRASFQSLLVSTLRHDPDVLVVGEIRNAESAEAIKDIVLAGRKVLATLHAYEAIAAFNRLEQIGVPHEVLYMPGFLSGVIYQRLLSKLCPQCAVPYYDAIANGLLDEYVAQRIERSMDIDEIANVRVRNPDGCSECRGRVPGVIGRVVCAEILVVNEELLELLAAHRMAAAKRLWLHSGHHQDPRYRTALGHGLRLMAQGLVDPREVESEVGLIVPASVFGARRMAAVDEPMAAPMVSSGKLLSSGGPGRIKEGGGLWNLYERAQ